MKKEEIVSRGVAAHARLDAALAEARGAALSEPFAYAACITALAQAKAASMDLEKVHEDGVAAGMVPRALAAKKIIHQSRMVTAGVRRAEHAAENGDSDATVDTIASVGLASAELHAEDTKIAQANGVDTGTVQSVAGVIIPMSGGR